MTLSVIAAHQTLLYGAMPSEDVLIQVDTMYHGDYGARVVLSFDDKVIVGTNSNVQVLTVDQSGTLDELWTQDSQNVYGLVIINRFIVMLTPRSIITYRWDEQGRQLVQIDSLTIPLATALSTDGVYAFVGHDFGNGVTSYSVDIAGNITLISSVVVPSRKWGSNFHDGFLYMGATNRDDNRSLEVYSVSSGGVLGFITAAGSIINTKGFAIASYGDHIVTCEYRDDGTGWVCLYSLAGGVPVLEDTIAMPAEYADTIAVTGDWVVIGMYESGVALFSINPDTLKLTLVDERPEMDSSAVDTTPFGRIVSAAWDFGAVSYRIDGHNPADDGWQYTPLHVLVSNGSQYSPAGLIITDSMDIEVRYRSNDHQSPVDIFGSESLNLPDTHLSAVPRIRGLNDVQFQWGRPSTFSDEPLTDTLRTFVVAGKRGSELYANDDTYQVTEASPQNIEASIFGITRVAEGSVSMVPGELISIDVWTDTNRTTHIKRFIPTKAGTLPDGAPFPAPANQLYESVNQEYIPVIGPPLEIYDAHAFRMMIDSTGTSVGGDDSSTPDESDGSDGPSVGTASVVNTLRIFFNEESTWDYDVHITFGDGTIRHVTNKGDRMPAVIDHSYYGNAVFLLEITGECPEIQFELVTPSNGLVTRVLNLGALNWKSLENTFNNFYVRSFSTVVSDVSQVVSMRNMFAYSPDTPEMEIHFYNMDIGNVTDFENLLRDSGCESDHYGTILQAIYLSDPPNGAALHAEGCQCAPAYSTYRDALISEYGFTIYDSET